MAQSYNADLLVEDPMHGADCLASALFNLRLQLAKGAAYTVPYPATDYDFHTDEDCPT